MWIGAVRDDSVVGRISYWGCKSNLCWADREGGGASNLTGADRGRMWIGAVRPASILPIVRFWKLFQKVIIHIII